MEPVEQAIISVPEEFAGVVIEKLGQRKGQMTDMSVHNKVTTLTYMVPTRGLLGYRAEFIMDTKGEGILHHSFSRYERYKGEISKRLNGVLISGEAGKTASYALENMQERGTLFVGPAVEVYDGMIIGENARSDDMTVNPCKKKKQTNIRAASADIAIKLTPHINLTLEQALEFIDEDELVEITPLNIRLRKKLLTKHDRSRNRGE
jgi:GTP-binding protein